MGKYVASMEIRMNVKTFFILTKPYDKNLSKYTRDVALWLLSKEKEQYIVYVDMRLQLRVFVRSQ